MNKAFLIVLAVAPLFAGCAHTHLRHRFVGQANSVNDVFEQQVLDNLAKFVTEPASIPSFSYPKDGTTNIVDNVSLASTSFNSFRIGAGIGGSRGGTEAWGLVPVTDSDKLYLMRCAYQRAVGCISEDPCIDCCAKRKSFEGKADREIAVSTINDKKQFIAKIDPTTGQPYIDPVTGALATQPDGSPAIDPKTGRPKFYISVPALDCEQCAVNSGWFCYGSVRDVPKTARSLVGHYKGTYVWVREGGHDQFSKLVLNILSIAVEDPASAPAPNTKKVKYFLDKDGELTNEDKAVGVVESTIAIGDRNESILSERLTDEEISTLVSAKQLSDRMSAVEQQLTPIFKDLKMVMNNPLGMLEMPESSALSQEDQVKLADLLREAQSIQEKLDSVDAIRQKLTEPPATPVGRRAKTPQGTTNLDLQRELQAIGGF